MRGTDRLPKALFAALALVLVAAACNDAADDAAVQPPEQPVVGLMRGAGSTLAAPAFEAWQQPYRTVQPQVSIEYRPESSEAGIEQFLAQEIDFAPTSDFLSDEEMGQARAARGCDPLHIPVLFGGVALAYNLPELDGEDLVVDARLISSIFRGELTNWNDPAIVALNPTLTLPDQDIVPVHREDSSGTTAVFTTWLAHEDVLWADLASLGREVGWPLTAVGTPGSDGVVTAIAERAGSVGYVNATHAVDQGLPAARVINADAEAVAPSARSIAAGSGTAEARPEGFRIRILGVGGDGYPLIAPAWVLAWECGYDDGTAAMLRDFLTWAVVDGGQTVMERDYASIPEDLRAEVLDRIDRINGGES